MTMLREPSRGYVDVSSCLTVFSISSCLCLAHAARKMLDLIGLFSKLLAEARPRVVLRRWSDEGGHISSITKLSGSTGPLPLGVLCGDSRTDVFEEAQRPHGQAGEPEAAVVRRRGYDRVVGTTGSGRGRAGSLGERRWFRRGNGSAPLSRYRVDVCDRLGGTVEAWLARRYAARSTSSSGAVA